MSNHVRVRGDGVIRRLFDRLTGRRPAPLTAPAFTDGGESGTITGLRAIRAETTATIAAIGVKLAQAIVRPLARVDRAIARTGRSQARLEVADGHLADSSRNLELAEAELHREVERTDAPVDRRIPTWLLGLGLLGIVIFDTPVNSTVFQAFAESQTLTRILALGFSLALVVVGHTVGDELHARRYRQEGLRRHWASMLLVALAGLLLVAGLVGSADLRSVYFAAEGLTVPLVDVLAIQLAVFGAAALLSYLHANRLLDQVDHWRRAVRRDERRRHRRQRVYTRRFAAVRRAWHRAEQLLREYLALVDAHVATCLDQQWRWVNGNGGAAVVGDVAGQVTPPELPAWVDQARSHPLLTESAEEAVVAPRLGGVLPAAPRANEEPVKPVGAVGEPGEPSSTTAAAEPAAAVEPADTPKPNTASATECEPTSEPTLVAGAEPARAAEATSVPEGEPTSALNARVGARPAEAEADTATAPAGDGASEVAHEDVVVDVTDTATAAGEAAEAEDADGARDDADTMTALDANLATTPVSSNGSGAAGSASPGAGEADD